MDWDLVTWLGRMPGVRGQNLDILELRGLGVVMGLDLSGPQCHLCIAMMTLNMNLSPSKVLETARVVHSPRLG